MKQVIENIEAKLNEVGSLKYIDENWGQLNQYGIIHPMQFPCALIDFAEVSFSNISNDREKTFINRQQGEAQLRIIMAGFKRKKSGGNGSHQNPQKLWQAIEEVHSCLQGYRPTPYCSALIRSSLKGLKSTNRLQRYQITYTTELYNV